MSGQFNFNTIIEFMFNSRGGRNCISRGPARNDYQGNVWSNYGNMMTSPYSYNEFGGYNNFGNMMQPPCAYNQYEGCDNNNGFGKFLGYLGIGLLGYGIGNSKGDSLGDKISNFINRLLGKSEEPKTQTIGEKFDDWSQQKNITGSFDFTSKYKDGSKTLDNYKEDATSFAKDYIKLYDTNGDGKIDYEEFKAKEIADAKKAGTELDPTNSDVIASTMNGFKLLDQNGDKMIDEKEETAAIAAMDKGPDENVTGNITAQKFSSYGALLGDESKKNEMQTKLKNAYEFLYGKK